MQGFIKVQPMDNRVVLIPIDQLRAVEISLVDTGAYHYLYVTLHVGADRSFDLVKRFESAEVAKLEFQKEVSNWEQFMREVNLHAAIQTASRLREAR